MSADLKETFDIINKSFSFHLRLSSKSFICLKLSSPLKLFLKEN